MNIRFIPRKAGGFTIAEVLISIAIIGISAAGLMGCFHFAMFAVRMARENERATQIALERTEAIRCYNWSDLGNVPTNQSDYYNRATQEKPIYSVKTSLDSFPYTTTYQDKMKRLTIVVSWTSWGVPRVRTNVTYIAFDGIQNYVY